MNSGTSRHPDILPLMCCGHNILNELKFNSADVHTNQQPLQVHHYWEWLLHIVYCK